jgi:hypothetical protein
VNRAGFRSRLPICCRPCFDWGMPRATDRNRVQREAEAKFPHRVDVPIPVGGLGNRLTEMMVWCRQNVPAGAWTQHAHSERHRPNHPADFARFYFATEADAKAFRKRWT